MMWFWISAFMLAAAAGGWMIRPLIIGSGETRPARGLALALVGLVPLAALALYIAIGRPEFANGALMQAQQEMRTYARLVDKLKAEVAARPDDPEGHRLLATSLSALARYDEALPAYRRALELGVKTPEIYTGFGEALTLTAKAVTPEAMAAFDQALALDANFQQALYYRAEGYFAHGDAEHALADWEKLASLAPAGSPLATAVHRNIELAQRMKSEPSPAIDQSAIAGMVERLAQRLDAEPAAGPHDLDGWERLVRSYVVLKDDMKKAAALAKAKSYFAGDAEALKRLDAASR